MPARATLTVDLGKVRDNARTVVDHLPGISVVAVTKVTCGSPQVGRAMLAGGARALGESQPRERRAPQDAGLTAPIWLLRAPVPELAGETVQLTDVSLQSELETVVALENAAAAAGRRHAVVAMVDLGDLREGMLPKDLPAFLERVNTMDHIDIAGIGVNLTCYGAIMPDEDNMGRLAELAAQSERQLGRPLLVSGGNSGSIGMVVSGRMPAAVDTLRIGETILLGVDTLTREPTLGLHLDAFTVQAPVIECLVKPSLPQGTIAQDAFGNIAGVHRPRRPAARDPRPRAPGRAARGPQAASTRASRCSARPATTSSSTSRPSTGRRVSATASASSPPTLRPCS